MKQINFFAIAFLVIVLASCQSGNETSESGDKYFRKLRFSESAYDQYTGLHEITADAAKKINHYKLSYDEDMRLVEVKYCRGEELLYGSSAGASQIVISYEGNKEIHSYFNRNGEQISRAGYYTAEFDLDDSGVRKHLRFYDKEGNAVENRNGIAWFDWEFLEEGKLKENRYNMEGEETVLNEFCPFYELRFDYDDKGFVTMMANYQGDSMYNCTVENCGDIGVSYFRFDYNEAGDITDFTVESLTGQLSNLYWGWARYEQKYDDHGNLIERVMFDQDDEPVGGMSIPVTQMVYDEYGSVIERKYMNINRQLINHPQSGISVEKYSYNELGIPQDTLRFDAQMTAI